MRSTWPNLGAFTHTGFFPERIGQRYTCRSLLINFAVRPLPFRSSLSSISMETSIKANRSSGLTLLQLLSGPRTQVEIDTGVRARHTDVRYRKGMGWVRAAILQTLLPQKLVVLQGNPGSRRLVVLTAAVRKYTFRKKGLLELPSLSSLTRGVAGTRGGAAAARRGGQHAGRACIRGRSRGERRGCHAASRA